MIYSYITISGVLLLMRHHNLDVATATKNAKSLRPIIDPIGMCVTNYTAFLCRCKLAALVC